tara:strand:- start:551 stop:790 length:240 start_codon:yes stop_codon:yes gene_type:complete
MFRSPLLSFVVESKKCFIKWRLREKNLEKSDIIWAAKGAKHARYERVSLAFCQSVHQKDGVDDVSTGGALVRIIIVFSL